MSVPVNTVTGRMLADLHSDSYANLVWWSQSQLTTFVDQALKRLARLAGVFVQRSTSTTVSTGTRTYSSPSRHLSTIRVTLNGAPLVASSTEELTLKNVNYETDTGTPKRWYRDTLGTGLIGLEPVPVLAVNGQTLAQIYHEFPTELDSSSNTAIPAPACIVDYLEMVALGEAYGAESDGALPEVAGHVREYVKLYEAMIKQYWGSVQ